MNRNNSHLCRSMLPTIQRVAGKDEIRYKPATTGSEDFSYFSRRFQFIPSLWKCTLKKPLSESKANHNPGFQVDEASLKFVTRLECNLLYDYLKNLS